MPSTGLTVLMSVYSGESARNLDASLRSLLSQTYKKFRILIVIDGPVPNSIHLIIDKYLSLLDIRTFELKENQGLAKALNAGLSKIDSEWTIRFDTDDICLPERISKQVDFIKSGKCDFFGAQIVEFMDGNDQVAGFRIVPCTHQEIKARILYRNPFNHMTMCYKTDLVRSVGGYPYIPFMEDYALWIKLVAMGSPCGNSQDVLVRVRAGATMLKRRSGIEYCKSEFKIRKLLCDLNYASCLKIYTIGLIRILGFMAPEKVKALIYKYFLRAKDGRGYYG